MRALLSLSVAGLLLGGCAGTLETRPYRERTDDLGAALKGVSYSLPKLQYEVKLTRYLAECPGEKELDGAPRLSNGKPTALKFAVEASETPQYVPGEAYTVDYQKLPGFLRTGTFEIKYWPNGNLKSVGAGAEDKTADFIRDTVKTGLSVASIIAGGALSGGPVRTNVATTSETVMGCTVEAMQLVVEARELRKALKERPRKIEKLVKDVDRFQARAALRLRDPRDREDLLKLFQDIDDEQEWVRMKTERLAELSEMLGVSQTIRWDSKPGKLEDQVWTYAMSDAQQNKLAGLLQPVSAAVAQDPQELERRSITKGCFGPFDDSTLAVKKKNCVNQHLNLTAAARLVTHLPSCTSAGAQEPECLRTVTAQVRSADGSRSAPNPQYRNARDDEPDSGIFVREPARGRLLFCRTAVLAGGAAADCTSEKDEGKLKEANFPQYGQLRYLPLRVRTFQAREMALSMAEDGRVESFSYKSTKSAGAALAAAAADAASQADAALERIETERRDDRKYAFEHANDELVGRITRLTKEAEERKLLAPPSPANPLQPQLDQAAALQVEVAILKLLQHKNDLLRAGAQGQVGP